MSEAAPDLTGLQKAAVILVTLGPIESAKVLKHIPEEDADMLARSIAQLDRIAPEQVEEVLHNFILESNSQQLYIKGGLDYAEKMLTEAYGAVTAKKLLERLAKSFGKTGFEFDHFRKTDPQQLAKLIQDEHPQTIALILSHLEVAQAAALLNSLPPESRTDVAIRMADLDQISPDVVRNIASVIESKLRNLGELRSEVYGGVRAVANILNRLDPNTCTTLMQSIEEARQPLFENIRRFMFVFRDLENLDATALTALTSKVPRATLILALKGADEALRAKFLATQSQRGAAMITEEIAALGPVKLRDVDAAQQEIISLAREMEKEGTISLKGSSDEQYVY
ncbi:MAG TPA: flagellar motor switch protein FliG [Bryobacteraceae bacterium]|jgi:flagellar motor switch protein FliG|nr:flagellar motor switch protein FliG [Bryobacteraceae bacterium]